MKQNALCSYRANLLFSSTRLFSVDAPGGNGFLSVIGIFRQLSEVRLRLFRVR